MNEFIFYGVCSLAFKSKLCSVGVKKLNYSAKLCAMIYCFILEGVIIFTYSNLHLFTFYFISVLKKDGETLCMYVLFYNDSIRVILFIFYCKNYDRVNSQFNH